MHHILVERELEIIIIFFFSIGIVLYFDKTSIIVFVVVPDMGFITVNTFLGKSDEWIMEQ